MAKKKVIFRTLGRDYDDDGKLYYVQTEEMVFKGDVPLEAKHVTGDANAHVLVSMEPRQPDYAKPSVDQDGNPAGNWVDAIGYHLYFVDTRIRSGFEELGKLKAQKALPDWKILLMLGVFGAVCVWMVSRMMRWQPGPRRRRSSCASSNRS